MSYSDQIIKTNFSGSWSVICLDPDFTAGALPRVRPAVGHQSKCWPAAAYPWGQRLPHYNHWGREPRSATLRWWIWKLAGGNCLKRRPKIWPSTLRISWMRRIQPAPPSSCTCSTIVCFMELLMKTRSLQWRFTAGITSWADSRSPMPRRVIRRRLANPTRSQRGRAAGHRTPPEIPGQEMLRQHRPYH